MRIKIRTLFDKVYPNAPEKGMMERFQLWISEKLSAEVKAPDGYAFQLDKDKEELLSTLVEFAQRVKAASSIAPQASLMEEKDRQLAELLAGVSIAQLSTPRVRVGAVEPQGRAALPGEVTGGVTVTGSHKVATVVRALPDQPLEQPARLAAMFS